MVNVKKNSVSRNLLLYSLVLDKVCKPEPFKMEGASIPGQGGPGIVEKMELHCALTAGYELRNSIGTADALALHPDHRVPLE